MFTNRMINLICGNLENAIYNMSDSLDCFDQNMMAVSEELMNRHLVKSPSAGEVVKKFQHRVFLNEYAKKDRK